MDSLQTSIDELVLVSGICNHKRDEFAIWSTHNFLLIVSFSLVFFSILDWFFIKLFMSRMFLFS
jgi:hypothetical protein